MHWQDIGYLHLPALISDNLDCWAETTATEFALEKPGHRITDNPELAIACDTLLQSPDLQKAIGAGWQCVRAIAFNKSPDANWALGWHQDRTIAVKSRRDIAGFGPWSVKDRVPHVEPPFELIENMVTLRLHLDDAGTDNGALLVAPKSHKYGLIREADIDHIVKNCGTKTCIAAAGDGWLYSTPILHASSAAVSAKSRRVLHLDFSRAPLPDPLEWHGIG